MIVFVLLAWCSLVTGPAEAHYNGRGHMHKLSQTKQVFENTECRSTDTCDLKRSMLTTSASEFWFPDDPRHPTYANGAIIEYETDSVAALERYAIVQFKKGCVYYSWQNGAGEVYKSVRDLVLSFGAELPFCFRDWVIDSQDTDPVYNSDPEYGRFYLLRWNKPGSYEERTQKFYGAEKPNTPAVYMADYPAGAFVAGTGVRNVALAFKTCIYKAVEVPLETWRSNTDFARPIHCFDWSNVYVYDFEAGVFHSNWPELPEPRQPQARPPALLLTLSIIFLIALVLAIAFLVRNLVRRFAPH